MPIVGAYFAFYVLPTIIFFSALTALLYFSGIMQYLVQGMAWIMQRTMGTSGARGAGGGDQHLCRSNRSAADDQAVLGRRGPNSELMAIMTAGFANIASGVLAAYAAMLGGFFPDIAGHLLAASLLSAPSSLVVAKLIFPEDARAGNGGNRTGAGQTDGCQRGRCAHARRAGRSAAHPECRRGAYCLCGDDRPAECADRVGRPLFSDGPRCRSRKILGWLATPFAWLTGMPWHDATQVGPLLGIKTAVNEFVAYTQMSQQLGVNAHFITPRSAIITTYALCGFANFSSVAIQIGGISGMAPTPSRRSISNRADCHVGRRAVIAHDCLRRRRTALNCSGDMRYREQCLSRQCFPEMYSTATFKESKRNSHDKYSARRLERPRRLITLASGFGRVRPSLAAGPPRRHRHLPRSRP